jgi:hypothetical protein
MSSFTVNNSQVQEGGARPHDRFSWALRGRLRAGLPLYRARLLLSLPVGFVAICIRTSTCLLELWGRLFQPAGVQQHWFAVALIKLNGPKRLFNFMLEC